MDGNGASPRPKLIKTAQSTPIQERDGQRIGLPLVKLAKYAVNVRSFHPNKQFEPLGFRFHGDNRGFSLGQSYFGELSPTKDAVTSRIWQRYFIDASSDKSGELTKYKQAALRQESNPSSAGPGLWAVLGAKESYNDPDFKPQGSLVGMQYSSLGGSRYSSELHTGQKLVARRSWYGGENYAFIGSRLDKKVLGMTVVPVLDVTSELYMRIERVNRYMDIVSLVYGDGFPNAEGFLQDAAGNKIFLGTHVRIGTPATHLGGGAHQRLMWANAIRVELDGDGNFAGKLWVFARGLGGPPTGRDTHPIIQIDEVYSKRPVPRAMGMLGSYTLCWDYAKPEALSRRDGKTSAAPIHLSAFSDIAAVRQHLERTWGLGPVERTTCTAWNDSHQHHDPNAGRSADDYDLSAAKWRKA